VSSYLTISPITPCEAGILSVALVVVLQSKTPGRYPARCPMVFGLSSSAFAEAITRRASLQGSKSIAKYVEQSNIMLQEPVCSIKKRLKQARF
jgi:hypothetical protein